MNFRTTAAVGAAVLFGSVASVVAATPAMAAESDCIPYVGTVCLADTAPNFGGQVWRQTPSQINGCRRLSPEGFNNEASIAINNTRGDGVLFLYDTTNCTGRNISLASGEGTQFRGGDAWLNNKTSSIRFIQA